MATQQLVRPNPAMTKGFEEVVRSWNATEDRMTLNGTVGCTAVLLFVLCVAGAAGWAYTSGLLVLVGIVGALGIAVLTAFKPQLAPKTSMIYAALQGYALGAISETYSNAYAGVVPMAVGLTVGITAALLLVYRSGLIPVTQNFRLAVAAATGGIMLFYLVSFGLSFFDIGVPLIHSSSGWGILFSVFVIVLASANLVVDFDFIENGVKTGAPKYMEWYGAFALVVTLVWLYLELLRLLAKLQNRN